MHEIVLIKMAYIFEPCYINKLIINKFLTING